MVCHSESRLRCCPVEGAVSFRWAVKPLVGPVGSAGLGFARQGRSVSALNVRLGTTFSLGCGLYFIQGVVSTGCPRRSRRSLLWTSQNSSVAQPCLALGSPLGSQPRRRRAWPSCEPCSAHAALSPGAPGNSVETSVLCKAPSSPGPFLANPCSSLDGAPASAPSARQPTPRTATAEAPGRKPVTVEPAPCSFPSPGDHSSPPPIVHCPKTVVAYFIQLFCFQQPRTGYSLLARTRSLPRCFKAQGCSGAGVGCGAGLGETEAEDE